MPSSLSPHPASFYITNSHFLRLTLRHSTRHPVQSLLLVLGIALGVAMMVAIDVTNDSASEAFTLSTDSIVGRATHQIVPAANGLPESLYTDLRVNLGLTEAAPVVTGLVLLDNAGGLPLQLLGVDPFAEAPFRSYLGGPGGLSVDVLTQLLVKPDTVLLSEELGTRYGLLPGDTLTLTANGHRRQVTLAGLLRPSDDLSRRGLSGLMLTDISTAQELLDKTGQLSHIDLILPPDADVQAILDRLPPNARLQTAALRNATIRQMTAAFNLNLSALSLLALIVGMFLIYNTISFSVVQRRPVLAVLRCLGVTRGEIFSLVLLEALVLGGLGAVIGLGLGVALGRGLVGLVTRTINDLYFTLTVQTVSISPWTLYKGLVAGLAASLLAAAVPAWEASTVPPHTALKRSEQEGRLARLLPLLSLTGAGLVAGGWLVLYGSGRSLGLSFTGMFMILFGAAMLTPLLTRGLMRLLLPLTRRGLGIVGVMAPRDIMRALSRTSVTIAALMLAVTVIIGVSIMIDSFRYTVTAWLDAVLAADIYVSPAGQGQGIDGEIAPEFIDQVRQIDGVARIGLLRRASVFSPDTGQVELRATTAQPSDLRRPLLWAEGSPDQALSAMEGDAVMVSEVFARRHGLPLDRPSTLTLTADDGPRPFRVVGIFYDYAEPELGYVFIRLDTYRRYWADDGVSNVALYLSPELAPRADALTRELEDRFAGRYTLTISSNRGIKQNALEVFDRTFTITAALRLLAVVVAFIGVLSTLMALQLERTRELGTLRATGMSLGQLWAKTLLETGLIGLTAGLLSWPVGLALALILIYVINLRSFGWSLQLHLSPTIFLLAMAISLSASLLAAVYPVLRMARLEIAATLREE